MSANGSKLFDLLPALYRLRDAQIAQSKNLPQGPLQSLVMLIEEQLAVVAEDLDQLYDDQFIETCAPWVIPYIGDLIGYQSVHGVVPAVASPRAEVAHTVSFRRRKGTVLVLEQLARDVTGWGAHAVEFFQVLAATQYMNHIRPHNHYAPDLRNWRPRAYMNTGFDRTAHRVDVRRIAVERGRYNIQNIGIFLWSLNAYSLTMSPAVAVAGSKTCFRFSPLGLDMPLFNHPVSQGSDITAPARPVNVPDVLLRRVLCEDLAKIIETNPNALNYDPGDSLVLYIDGSLVVPSKIQVCDLSGPDGNWNNLPPAGSPFSAAIDPELGRIALPPPAAGANPIVQASFFYGFNADMGGGEYPRADSFSASPEQVVVRVPGDYPTIQAALSALPGDGVVEITDSGRYQESGGLAVAVKANGHIELRAAEECRPTLVLGAEISVTGSAESMFDLNGLLVAYAPPSPGAPLPAALVHAPNGGSNLGHLGLTHCTLVPGSLAPALLASTPGLEIVVQKSIVGSLWVNQLAAASISDSIVDAVDPAAVAYAAGPNQPGGALTLQGCTIIGKIYASLLSLVSNSIAWAKLAPVDSWKAPLWAIRKQEGCARFSYIPAGSITPREFQCVEQGPESPLPLFYSLRYGDPAYAKFSPLADDAIRRGADDGGEMGAFHFLLAPLRETDLRVRLREFMAVGLEFGIFYEN
jgi:hypothetical protein